MGATKNGGVDAKFNGFCRTNATYRAHYKIARMKQAKIAEDKSMMMSINIVDSEPTREDGSANAKDQFSSIKQEDFHKTANTLDGKSSGQNAGGLPEIKNALKGTKTADRNEIAKLKMEHEEA